MFCDYSSREVSPSNERRDSLIYVWARVDLLTVRKEDEIRNI